jgi:hypothetical protein
MINKKIIILVTVLCLSLFATSVVLAQDITATKGGHFKVTADAKQLETLNSLYNTDISFGELIEAVYPETLEYIPDQELKNMYNTKVIWPSQDTPSGSETTAQQADSKDSKSVIIVGHESNLSTGQTIDFDSGSRVWSPNPYYRIPYMTVLTALEREGTGIVISAFEGDSNVYEISASGSYSNPPSDDYRTVGIHVGTYPSGYVPSSYAAESVTSWKEAP